MDLYPFYPPIVLLLRPRFSKELQYAIMSLSCLNPETWDSIYGLNDLLQELQRVIQNYGSIQIDSHLNSLDQDDASYYFELLLIKFSFLCPQKPRLTTNLIPSSNQSSNSNTLSSVEKTNVDDATTKSNRSKTSVWNIGVGYGSGEHNDKAS